MQASDLVRRNGHTSVGARPMWRNPAALLAAFLMLSLMAVVAVTTKPALAGPEPVFTNKAPDGEGFTLTPGDLKFILRQIKISERHATTATPATPCETLGGPGPNQIPDRLSSYGLRTVDGSCNNLYQDQGRAFFGAADQTFPRLTKPRFVDPEGAPGFPVPSAPGGYNSKKGNVVDAKPRTISNLIVDQTSTNPAAVAAAKFPVRTQGNAGVDACTTDPPLAADGVTETGPGIPAGCTPSHKTLFMPNVTTDVGLSPPYNSVFTFFGQFFDHGVDQTVKSGSTVFVPLRPDDPLVTSGRVSPSQAFMVLTRAQNQPGGDQNATNTDTPWVDQSQTYTSHASHQVFLREYTAGTGTAGPNNAAAVATGKLLHGLPAGQTYSGSPDMTGGESTWASVKIQAHDLLGLRLVDTDVTNIPMLATDPYGKYLPGPHGLPQYVTATGLVEGQRDNPATTTVDETVPVPGNVLHFDT